MKHRAVLPCLTLIVLAVVVPSTVASAGPLDTRVTMLIGSPGSGDETASVLVVPGTVIPVTQTARGRSDVTDDSAQRARRMQDLTDKLRRAVGLESVEVAYSEIYGLESNKAWGLRGPRPESSLEGDLTLLDFNDTLAVYRVELRQGGVLLADSKVAVERGGRAVVGGLDGDEAPHFFLVLEPAAKALFVKGDVTHPRKLHFVVPSYTEEARKRGIQGLVILQGLISEQGTVEEIEVLQGLPFGLNETAIEALRQWTFEPATLGGKPVAVYYNLTFNFRLSNDKEAAEESDS